MSIKAPNNNPTPIIMAVATKRITSLLLRIQDAYIGRIKSIEYFSMTLKSKSGEIMKKLIRMRIGRAIKNRFILFTKKFLRLKFLIRRRAETISEMLQYS
jgi:hypothetical protein